MTLYEAQPALFTIIGRTAERPVTPPDKQCLFWDIQAGLMYAVNDLMQWVTINPPPAPYTGESHIRVAPVVTSIFPSALMWAVPSLGALIYEVRFVIDSAYDMGIDLSIGDVGDNERLMKTTDIIPQVTNDYLTPYKTQPIYQYAPGAAINIYCSSSPSTGSGTVYIFYDENPS